MARIVLTDVEVTIGGTVLSDHIASVTLTSTYDVIETTAFGNTGQVGPTGTVTGASVPAAARQRIAGLVDNSVTLEFHQDFASNEVEATIYPLLGTVAAISIQPVASTGATATNPQYNFYALVSEWTPLNGAVGELSTASVTWPISGPISKATS